VSSALALLVALPAFGQLVAAAGTGDVAQVAAIAPRVAGAMVARELARAGSEAAAWRALLALDASTRAAAFSRLVLKADVGILGAGLAPGDAAARLTGDCDAAVAAAFGAVGRALPAAIQAIAVLGRMTVTSPPLALLSLLLAPAMAALLAALGAEQRRLAAASRRASGRLAARAAEVLPVAAYVRVSAAAPREAREFAGLARSLGAARLRLEARRTLIPAAVALLYSLTVAALLLAGANLVAAGALGGDALAAFLASLVLLIEPVQALGAGVADAKTGEAALERVLELLRAPAADYRDGLDEEGEGEEEEEGEDARALRRGAGGLAVELDDVWFAHPPRNAKEAPAWALRGVTLAVAAGETLALVGPSGGGKSTIAAVALALHAPQRGTVRVGGVLVDATTCRAVWQASCLVPQDPVLLPGRSVAENVAYGGFGQHGPDAQRVRQALRDAEALDVVEALPGGIHARLGASPEEAREAQEDADRADSAAGGALSGGERQRLAVARALYLDAGLAVLDEATGALDPRTAGRVKRALAEAGRGRTVLLVAHDLTLALAADTVAYVDAGRILEMGSPKTLAMDSTSHFRRLLDAERRAPCDIT